MLKTPITQFVEKVFGYDLEALDRKIVATTDRTLWYKVRHSDKALFTPPTNVLKVNSMELDKFIGAVESFCKFPLDDPKFNWDESSLTLLDFGGSYSEVEKGMDLIESEITRLVAENNGEPILVGTDIECRDLEWENNHLICIGFALTKSYSIALYHIPPELYSRLEALLTRNDVRYVWDNGKFDGRILYYSHKVKIRVDEDTGLKHFVQISETKGHQKLKVMGPIYVQAPQWDDALQAYKKEYCRKHKMLLKDFKYDMFPIEMLVHYMHFDCLAPLRLLEVFEELKEEGTDWIYQQLIRASNVFIQIELAGVDTDKPHLELLQDELTADLKVAEEKVADAVKAFWNPTNYAKETGAKFIATFNIKSPKQLKWLLSKVIGYTPASTDADTMEDLAKQVKDETLIVSEAGRDLFDGIMKSRKASKYLDTYVTGMLDATCNDGRVRGTYNLHGTETGRFSGSNPNMLNVPRNKHIKNIFKAREGYVLIQGDESQAELRVMAYLTGDPALIEVYKNNRDLHCEMAEKIFGADYTKEDRNKAKSVNFGAPFGRGVSALVDSKDFELTRVQAEKILRDWFAAVPVATEWMKQKRRDARKGLRQPTIFGRVRHYTISDTNMYHIENNYINTPIQSTASDLVMLALLDFYDWLVAEGLFVPWHPELSSALPIITVYDSVVVETKNDPVIINKVATKLKSIMEEIPATMLPDITFPFRADIEIGSSWGKLKDATCVDGEWRYA